MPALPILRELPRSDALAAMISHAESLKDTPCRHFPFERICREQSNVVEEWCEPCQARHVLVCVENYQTAPEVHSN